MDFLGNVSDFILVRIVSESVRQAIAPFEPGLVTMWVDHNIDLRKTYIHITCSTFVDDEAVIDGDSLYFMPQDHMAEWVGEQAGAYFASLMDESVPDTIVLGEN